MYFITFNFGRLSFNESVLVMIKNDKLVSAIIWYLAYQKKIKATKDNTAK